VEVSTAYIAARSAEKHFPLGAPACQDEFLCRKFRLSSGTLLNGIGMRGAAKCGEGCIVRCDARIADESGDAPSVGRMEIIEAVQSFLSAFPDLRVGLDRLVKAGDRVEYHWALTGTNTGPGGTGRGVRISGFESCRIRADS